MMRKCSWCGMRYETNTGSSVWCPLNPNRGRGASRLKKSPVVIGVVTMPKRRFPAQNNDVKLGGERA